MATEVPAAGLALTWLEDLEFLGKGIAAGRVALAALTDRAAAGVQGPQAVTGLHLLAGTEALASPQRLTGLPGRQGLAAVAVLYTHLGPLAVEALEVVALVVLLIPVPGRPVQRTRAVEAAVVAAQGPQAQERVALVVLVWSMSGMQSNF